MNNINNHLNNLLEDKNYSTKYFGEINILEEFKHEKYMELLKNINNSKNKYYKCINICNLTKHIGTKRNLTIKRNLLTETKNIYSNDINKLNIFKINLSYLIITGILNKNNLENLGYNNKDVNDILNFYHREKSYHKYLYYGKK